MGVNVTEGYFWFSLKQLDMIHHSYNYHVNYCKVNGKILEYTEWKRDTSKSNWDDAVLLGFGEYYGNDRTLTNEQIKDSGKNEQ